MTKTRPNFRLIHRLRVRWAEVDMQKIVFNAHYLMYLDTAMADYWRALAWPYEASMVSLGGDLYVKKAALEYHGSARYDDVLEVGLTCTRVGNSSVTFEGAIFSDNTLLVSAELVYVFADPASQRPQPVPPAMREAFTAYESGQAMFSLQLGDWTNLQKASRELRHAVFIVEQGIDPRLEWDEHDAGAVHAVIFNSLKVPIASGRLLQPSPGEGRIGRMAVHRALRGSKLGRELLAALVRAAKDRGDTEVSLHAQCSAQGFYERSGFTVRGSVFEEAGIRHIDMVLPLTNLLEA